jgi:hypothetical protein
LWRDDKHTGFGTDYYLPMLEMFAQIETDRTMSDSPRFEPGLPYKLAGQLFLGKRYFCDWCKQEVLGFVDRLSAAEFRTTGMCQSCQDKAFAADHRKKKKRRR